LLIQNAKTAVKTF